MQQIPTPQLNASLTGLSLQTSCLDLKTFCDGTTFSASGTFISSFFDNKLAIAVNGGKLNLSGTWTKITSPDLYSGISPFSLPAKDIPYVKASLSSDGSFSKPDGLFFQIEYKNKSSIINNSSVNLYFDTEKKIISSVWTKLKPLGNFIMDAGWTVTSFLPEEPKSDSWYEKTPFYLPERLINGSVFLRLSPGPFSSSFYINHYESLEGDLCWTFRNENILRLKNIKAGISLFYNPTPFLITASQKKIYPDFSLKTNIQFLQTLRIPFPLYLKEGMTVFSSIKFSDTKHTVKISPGFQATTGFLTLSIDLTGAFQFVTDINGQPKDFSYTSWTISCRNTWTFWYLNPGLQLSIIFKPEKNTAAKVLTEDFQFFLNFVSNPTIDMTGSFSLTQKNNQTSISNQKISARLNYKGRYTNISGTISFQWK